MTRYIETMILGADARQRKDTVAKPKGIDGSKTPHDGAVDVKTQQQAIANSRRQPLKGSK